MEYRLNDLNEVQKQAALQTEGAVLVSAGAGTGKTRLLTYRIAHLVLECGVQPENILAITFTNKATQEMKIRIENMLKEGYRVTVSTFHSLCAKILRQYIHYLSPSYNQYFTIYDDSDSEKLLKQIFQDQKEPDNEFRKFVANFISKAKSEGVLWQDFAQNYDALYNAKEIAKYYRLYEEALEKNNALDFDDLLIKTIALFKKDPRILEHFQNKFKYIHIDEFQDTNTVQYEMAVLLAQKHGNILIVGDEDQSIYSWRGANYRNLFKFCEDFKGAKVFKLEENYRSTKEILEKANNLIVNNSQRFAKNLYTNNASGEDIAYTVQENDTREADYVAKKILSMVRQEGYSFSDFAVLYRINAMSRLIENAFVSYGIPYTTYGALKFYARAEVKNVLAYLRIFINKQDDEALRRIINFPKRGIGDVTMQNIADRAAAQGVPLLQFVLENKDKFKNKGIGEFANFYLKIEEDISCLNPVSAIRRLVEILGLEQFYKSTKTEEDIERFENIKALILAVKDFYEANTDATLANFLENVSLMSDIDKNDLETSKVALASVHAVKGLEFNNVFIIAVEEGMFPFSRSVEEGNLEEERRLMYVAITRAKQKLFISRSERRMGFEGIHFCKRSSFLAEMGMIEKAPERNFSTYYQPVNRFDGYTEQKQKENAQSFKPLHTLGLQKASSFFKDKDAAIDIAKFKAGQIVEHTRFGLGKILEIVGEQNAKILFDNQLIKELNLAFAPLKIVEE